MVIFKRRLCGDMCDIATYGAYMRLMVTTAVPWNGTADDARVKLSAAGIRANVELFDDYSLNITTAQLINWRTADDDICAIVDRNDTAIEKALGLAVGESVTSGSWNAGHNEAVFDCLLSETERRIIANG